jgi:hypothetical protein
VCGGGGVDDRLPAAGAARTGPPMASLSCLPPPCDPQLAAAQLLLGDGSKAVAEKRVASCQTVGGTGALRMGAELLR